MLSVEDIPEIFRDLTPIPQNDGPDRVCVIQYPSAFTLAYNYMRAVWAAKELSGVFVCLFVYCLSYVLFRVLFPRESIVSPSCLTSMHCIHANPYALIHLEFSTSGNFKILLLSLQNGHWSCRRRAWNWIRQTIPFGAFADSACNFLASLRTRHRFKAI
jgi:hypothetical protein